MSEPENTEKTGGAGGVVPAPVISSVKDMFKGLVGKQGAWLRAYLDEDNKRTFMNKTRAAEAAGYHYKTRDTLSSIGNQNFRKLQQRIEMWLDEIGLSEAAIKQKIFKLAHAKKTKFFQHQGVVTDTKEVDDLAVQSKMVQLAADVKGMRAAEKHEITGPGGADLHWTTEIVDATHSSSS